MYVCCYLFLFFIFLSVIDYFIIKFEIKYNAKLFYDLHRNEIIKVLNNERKD